MQAQGAPQETQESASPPKRRTARDVIGSRGFWIGFMVWYFVLGIVWALATGGGFSTKLTFEGFCVGAFVLPVSLLAIIILSAIGRTRLIGAGMLAAFATSLIAVLLLGISVASPPPLCSMPSH